jgi:hypothetical protein
VDARARVCVPSVFSQRTRQASLSIPFADDARRLPRRDAHRVPRPDRVVGYFNALSTRGYADDVERLDARLRRLVTIVRDFL